MLLGTLVCALFLSNSTAAMVTGIIIHLLIGILTVLFARWTWAKAKDLADSTLQFHDFLINYKSTPRSKILRRHLPELQAVVEEASDFEQSQYASMIHPEMKSFSGGSILASVQKKSVLLTKSQIFAYKEGP